MRSFLAFAIAVVMIASVGYSLELTVPTQTISVPTSGIKTVPLVIIGQGTIDVNILDEKIWTSLDSYLVTVNENGTKTITLTIAPHHGTTLGLYKISVVATELATGAAAKKDVFIYISKGDSIIVNSIFVNGNPEPLGVIDVTFHLSNVGEVPYQDSVLYYVINSSDMVFAGELPVSLNPGESTTLKQSFTFPRGTPAGSYEISAVIKDGDKQLTQEKQYFTVSKKPILRQDVNEATGFLVKERTVTLFNYGNDVAADVDITDTLSGLSSFFFLGTKPNDVVDNTFTWRVAALEPGEASVVSYRIDYTPLLFFAVAILLAAWYLAARSRKVSVVKRVLEKKLIDEMTMFTVGITIHNKAGKVLNDVAVSDLVPPIFTVSDAPGMKSQKKKTESGTELHWKLSDLRKGEERVLTYKITPLFGINGTISLPPAHTRYTSGKISIVQKSRQPTLGMHVPTSGSGNIDLGNVVR